MVRDLPYRESIVLLPNQYPPLTVSREAVLTVKLRNPIALQVPANRVTCHGRNVRDKPIRLVGDPFLLQRRVDIRLGLLQPENTYERPAKRLSFFEFWTLSLRQI